MTPRATQMRSGLLGLAEMFPDLCSQGSQGDVPIPVLREGLSKCLTTSRVSSPSFNIRDVPKDSCPHIKGADIRKVSPSLCLQRV